MNDRVFYIIIILNVISIGISSYSIGYSDGRMHAVKQLHSRIEDSGKDRKESNLMLYRPLKQQK